MHYVYDTNILIDWSRGYKPALECLQNYKNRFISRITWAEFLIGFDDDDQRSEFKKALKQEFEIIDTNEDIASYAVDIRRTHKIKLTDALIYGAAKNISGVLVTRDQKDFDVCAPDIHIPYKL